MIDLVPRRPLATIALTGALLLAGGVLAAAPAQALPVVPSASATPAVVAATLTIAPTVGTGDTVTATIHLTGAANVYAYELHLDADPALLSYVVGSATGPQGGFDAARSASDGVILTHTRLGTSPAITGDISASATLRGVAPGTAALRAGSLTLLSSTGEEVTSTDLATASIEVTPVAGSTDAATEGASEGSSAGSTDAATEGSSAGSTDAATEGSSAGSSAGSTNASASAGTEATTDAGTTTATGSTVGTPEAGGPLPSTGATISAVAVGTALLAIAAGFLLFRLRKAKA